jgi:hypothetical protein
MRWPLLLTSCLFAAALPALQAGQSGPQADPVQRHRRFVLGDRPLESFGDLELRGAMVHAQGELPWRAWIRRQPFALREEFLLPDGKRMVMVANAERAWRRDGADKSTPMQGRAAVEFLAHAFFDGLSCLAAGELESRTTAMERGRLEAQPELPADLQAARAADVLSIGTPVGTAWQGFVDDDGKLHGLFDRSVGLGTWIRYGRWRTFDGLTLPTLRVQGSAGIPALGTLRIDHVDTRRTADPALFAGDPSPAPNADVSASPLTILPGATPNSAHLLLPRVVVHGTAGRHAAPALLDTGAEFIAVAPDSAARLQLVPLAAAATVGGVGTLTTRHVWFDAIEVGEARFVQVLGSALPLPALPALPNGAQAALILGGAHLLRSSPVLDLRAEKLWLRARPVQPLTALTEKVANTDGPRIVMTTPLRRCGPGRHAVELDVRADDAALTVMLDTGCSELLMITPRGLRRLAWPLTRDAWLARGAVPLVMAGAGGLTGEMLLVRLASVHLAGLRYERPLVLVAPPGQDPHAPDLPYEGLLGAGALLALERVGIDEQRMRLELEPRRELLTPDGEPVVVPAPGPFLGILLGHAQGHEGLPVVAEVVSSTPAAAAGVQAGDIVLAIDGESCRGQDLPAVRRRLWLGAKEQLHLSLRRGTEEIEVTLP